MEQHDIDEANREKVVVSKTEVLREIKKLFCESNETLKKRSQEEQNIIGNLITITESELKKRIKNLPEL